MQQTHHYLLILQFLGFRYSGWQRQPGTKTVEGMLRKTLRFVLPGRSFKLLGAGRTDALVSAEAFAVQFMLSGAALDSEPEFFSGMNRNLPPDIRLLSLQQVPTEFNVIRDSLSKTYRYYFAFGSKPHPFCAPFLGYFEGPLDMDLMKEAAGFFVGEHNFRAFIGSPSEKTRTLRHIALCHVKENRDFTASFFPEQSYFLEVTGPGFGRYQVRRIMAALVALGRGTLEKEVLLDALQTGRDPGLKEIAPASGLHLIDVRFPRKS